MSTLTTFLIAIAGLLLTILGLIAKQDVNVEIRKILTWIVFVIITLLLPSFSVTWLTMQIVARILAPTLIDLSEFTSQVSWWTGSVSMIYPLVWGVWLYPRIRLYIREKILAPSNARKDKNGSSSKKQKETAK
ncbi:MAG: hypothetical protein HFACDABA_03256 [Anaerolineales bacterium]|nr:hypothetical protein [Anaerolineales bacterium]